MSSIKPRSDYKNLTDEKYNIIVEFEAYFKMAGADPAEYVDRLIGEPNLSETNIAVWVIGLGVDASANMLLRLRKDGVI